MSAKSLISKYPDVFIGKNVLRICRICEKTLGISQFPLEQSGWDISHGLCDRHFVRMLKMADIPMEEIRALLVKATAQRNQQMIHATRDLEFDNDFTLVNWLYNPTPYER